MLEYAAQRYESKEKVKSNDFPRTNWNGESNGLWAFLISNKPLTHILQGVQSLRQS